jgi:predicted O-methyltransferase YrrM
MKKRSGTLVHAFMPTNFSRDFTSAFETVWTEVLGHLADRPDIHGIEIGCFEGRTSCWFLENILTHSSSRLTCIDVRFAPAFSGNVAAHIGRVEVMETPSRLALRDPRFAVNSIDFAYVDGNHTAPFVLEDAVLTFPLLKDGGIMVFDDYKLRSMLPHIPRTMPKLAIDAFLEIYASMLTVLHKDWQVVIRKKVLS